MYRFAGSLALILGYTAALVCGGSSVLPAQEVQLRSQAGLDLPTRISLEHGVLHVRQKVGVTMGSRLTLVFNPRFDVVTSVNYTPGYAMVHGAGKRIDIGTGSHLLTAATGARYWLRPRAQTLAWEVHTGLGVVFGGKPAYEDLFEASTVTGIVGTSVRYQIGQIVSVQMRIQERLYRVRFGGFGERDPVHSKPLQVSFGFGLPFLDSVF